ncbi:hypothetical protein L6452_34769 [Arctium lappa]|uniref:Uncharacterized protein n=1 Tax=Arctium lappa TaxID=4217 RepID=A0ACB8YJ78_ARCLA|nr:hypothetical protein L6452_34769 [Arctium lappa]
MLKLGLRGLQTLLGYLKDKDPDKVSVALASVLDYIAQLELLQAPGLSFLLTAQYTNYPRLTGRAIVEFRVEKGDGSMFTLQAGGIPIKAATIQSKGASALEGILVGVAPLEKNFLLWPGLLFTCWELKM